MNNEAIYQNLLEQYKELSEKEKYALLIYNSNFYHHINAISEIDGYENKTPDEIFKELSDSESFVNGFEVFKKILEYPQNKIIKNSVFKDVDLDNILLFIDSMKLVLQYLKEAKSKIKLRSDMVVYRGISVKKGTNVDSVSKSEIVSTSINVDDANDFIFKKGFDESHLFAISLKEGTNVLVTPVTFVYDYHSAISMLRKDTKNATLKISNRRKDGQQEVILFRDDLKFNELSVDELDVGESTNLIVHKVEGIQNLEKSNERGIRL